MTKPLHKLVQRQLKRYSLGHLLTAEHKEFLQAISEAYQQHEQEVRLLERSLFLTSNELNERNNLLKDQLLEITKMKNQLLESLSVLNATFDATGENILVYDVKGKLITTNEMGREFFTAAGVEAHSHWSEFLNLLRYPRQMRELVSSLRQEPLQHITGVFEFANGRFYEYRSQPQQLHDKLIGRVWCFHDVTLQKKAEETIQHQAYHDALTGLPNRLLLLDRIEHALQLAKREEYRLAVLYIDLDNFKRVNDTEGHNAGDILLKEVVARIRSRLREKDTLARIGGDEFVILVEGEKQKQDIEQLCLDLLKILGEPFVIQSRLHYVTSSIGIALYPDDDAAADSLIRKADMAMYNAKKLGKNTFELYTSALELEARKQVQLERELREALNLGQLKLYYQPKVCLKTMEIRGAEVLMRWFKEDGSAVPPDIFIPLAESTGLISLIGIIAIDSAFNVLEQCRSLGCYDFVLSINLSVVEFQDPTVINHLLQRLKGSPIKGERLIVELTESIFMQDRTSISNTMNLLKEHGIAFALDDFGMGYSSFSYLQTLPLDYLKLDKAFLRDVTTNKQSSVIARTIIDIGHNLELDIIAEGIEDQATLDYVQGENCSFAQGFYLYRPLSEEDLVLRLKKSLPTLNTAG